MQTHGSASNSDVAVDIDKALLEHELVGILRRLTDVRDLESRPDLSAVRAALTADRCDVLILSGVAASALRDVAPAPESERTRVVILIHEADLKDACRATPGDADDVVFQREISGNTLTHAPARTAADETSMPNRSAREVAVNGLGNSSKDSGKRLSARERTILVLLADGLSNKQVGQRLGISEHGAKRLVTNVLLKLNSPNRTAAVASAIREEIIS